MGEKDNDQKRRLSLFERMKESILKKAEEAEPAPVEKPKEAEPDRSMTLGKTMVDVPTDSFLYALWYEWNVKSSEDQDEGAEEALEEKDKRILESLEIELEGADEAIPLSRNELESERQRAAVSLLVKAKKHHLLTQPNEEGEIPSLDAEIIIHVAQKRMAAWAFVFPPTGDGAPLQRPQLDMTLAEYSVSAGLDEEALNHIIEDQPYFRMILIAKGKPMIPGEDGYIIENYARNLEKNFEIDEKGNVDYRVQNYIQIIHAGDVLCQAVLPTPGEDGYDVLGSVIPAKEGKEAKLLAGQNTTLSEDKTQLVAKMEGHLRYETGRFHVKPTFYVSGDVDYGVGNIDFLGDVHVTGDVREGFVIKATGTVTVDGMVEGAVIESGGDIIIANGILGDDRAVLKAAGIVQAEYLENCIVYAGHMVRASSIIGSYINCDDIVTVKTGRGTIIGGKVVAARKIEANIIGCRAERTTVLIAGELPYNQKVREETEQAIAQLLKEIEEVDRTLQYLGEATGQDPVKVQRAADFKLRKSVLSMQLSHLQKKLEEVTSKESRITGCIIIAGTVYPVTQIRIHESTYTIQDMTGNVGIHLVGDDIVLR